MRWKPVYGTLALGAVVVAGAAGGGIWYALQLRAANMPRGPSLRVPRAFREARETTGHRVHLGQGLECGRCHTLADGGMGRVDVAACLECHREQQLSLHDEVMRASSPQCTSCHEFGLAETVPAGDCARCHGEVAEVTNDAHAAACLSCHSPHGDAPVVGTCAGCHAEPSRWHPPTPARAAANEVGCLDCHDIHGQTGARAPDRCITCHADDAHAVVEPGRAGHDQCVDCHDPHATNGRVARRCESCHSMRDHLAPAHGACTTCHAPHTPDASPASRRCASCHTRVAHDHPPSSSSCTSCHDAHPERDEPATATCASCHAREQPHAGGLRCTQCHAPHDFAGPAPARACSTCHEAQAAAAARTASGTDAGHRRCVSCHAGAHHEPQRRTAACSSCHTTEHSTAPAGHRDCTTCHAPHDGALTSRGSTCTHCHRDERTGHGARQECTSCHRPHGPDGRATPPTCTSCHERRTLPSLHTVSAHGTCATCHTAHEERPRSDRRTCTGSCHQTMANHQPEATLCAGCHPFQ